MDENLIDIIDLSLKFVGAITAFILFIIGYKRYKKDQDWKIHEFVAKEIKEFYSDPQNSKAMMMLDWQARNIELFPWEGLPENRYSFVTYDILAGALVYHGNKPGGKFSREEAVIRDIFDHFLSDLDRFYQFIEAGLVNAGEFRPYLQYWINKISGGLTPELRRSMKEFITMYEYAGVLKLFDEFGIRINELPGEKLDNF